MRQRYPRVYARWLDVSAKRANEGREGKVTITEAMSNGVLRVRLNQWANPNAYLLLPLLPDGGHGPWTELYDPPSQGVLGIRPGSQRILSFTMTNSDWVEYGDEPSEWEWHPDNYANLYARREREGSNE